MEVSTEMRWWFGRRVTCREVLVGLQSYLDGETDSKEARQLAGHLDHCEHCDHERRLYSSIKASLSARRTRVDPDVLAALRAYSQRLGHDDQI